MSYSYEKFQTEYKKKLVTVEEAANVVKSGDIITMPTCGGEPKTILNAIAARARRKEFENVEIQSAYTAWNCDVYDPELLGNIILHPLFVNTPQRWAIDSGQGIFSCIYYQDMPTWYDRGYLPIDIFVAEVTPMDKHGYFNFGPFLSHSQSIARIAKKIILQVNERLPRVFGDNYIHISDVDLLIEDNHEIEEMPIFPPNKLDEAMGHYIADIVPDGACLQIGVGGTSNAVINFLADKKDLGLHSEAFPEVAMDLVAKGAINNSKKNIDKGKSTFTWALGTRQLYDYLDENPGVATYQVDYMNDPFVIAKNDNVVSINATIAVDLTGQCASESIGTRQFSGVGGQADFARGAFLSNGGKSIICTYSTAKKGTVSSIVPTLAQGAVVSNPRTNVMYIATEYGIADLVGKTTRDRCKALINIAHPDFRDQLTLEAKKIHLL